VGHEHEELHVIRQVAQAWERLLLTSVGGRPLAATRLLYAAAALVLLHSNGRRMGDGLDPDRLHIPWPLVGDAFQGIPIELVRGAWIAGALVLASGIAARAGAAVLVASMLVFYGADRQHYGNGAYFIILIGILVVLADSGASRTPWGPDRRLASWWPAFLLASQLSIVYLFAAVQKARSSSLRGDTIAWQLKGPLVDDVTWSLLPEALNALGGLAELFCAMGLWFVLTRKLAVVVGVVLHLGVLLFVRWSPDLLAFGLASVSLYPAFWAASGPLGDEVGRWRSASTDDASARSSPNAEVSASPGHDVSHA
jgi:hypothetical protein